MSTPVCDTETYLYSQMITAELLQGTQQEGNLPIRDIVLCPNIIFYESMKNIQIVPFRDLKWAETAQNQIL